MVAAALALGGHRSPGVGRRRVELRLLHVAVARAVVVAAHREQVAVGQDHRVDVAPRLGQGRLEAPAGRRVGRVELLGGRGREAGDAVGAADQEHLRGARGRARQEDARPVAVVTVDVQVGDVREAPVARIDEDGVRVAGAGEDDPAVGQDELVRVVVDVAVRHDPHGAGAVAVGRGRVDLEVAVVGVGAAAGLVPAGRDQHLAVGQLGGRRVPATVAHVGASEPGLGRRVEDPDLVQALERAGGAADLVLQVAADHEHPAVGQQDLARAPDVGGHVAAHAGLGGRVPHHHPAARLVAELRVVVEEQNLAVRHQRGVDGHDAGEVDRPAPLAHLGRRTGVDPLGRRLGLDLLHEARLQPAAGGAGLAAALGALGRVLGRVTRPEGEGLDRPEALLRARRVLPADLDGRLDRHGRGRQRLAVPEGRAGKGQRQRERAAHEGAAEGERERHRPTVRRVPPSRTQRGSSPTVSKYSLILPSRGAGAASTAPARRGATG